MTSPLRELLTRNPAVRGRVSYVLPIVATMAGSMSYELIEWAAALLFGGELGMAYLGTQGDVWDAHKDMALAVLGAVLGMLALATVNTARANQGRATLFGGV